jgi:hypothetical protein
MEAMCCFESRRRKCVVLKIGDSPVAKHASRHVNIPGRRQITIYN